MDRFDYGDDSPSEWRVYWEYANGGELEFVQKATIDRDLCEGLWMSRMLTIAGKYMDNYLYKNR